MQGYTNASAAATIRLVNQSATFSTQSTPDYAAYPCRAAIAITGCTPLKQATVTYNPTEAISGNYAPFCETYNGGVYLYSKVTGTITVAAIVLEGVSNFYNMEATPTQNSGNPITSGGVYTNCVLRNDALTITSVQRYPGSAYASDTTHYVTPQAIANWNGAYTATTSNLAYCNQGAFGNVVTHANSEFVHTTNNENVGGAKTFTNCVYIQSNDGNYREGVRINRATSGWTTIVIGSTQNSTSGRADGWTVHRDTNGYFVVSDVDSAYGTSLFYGTYDSSTGYHTLHVPHYLDANASSSDKVWCTGWSKDCYLRLDWNTATNSYWDAYCRRDSADVNWSIKVGLAGYADSAGAVAWSNVSGKPGFVNDGTTSAVAPSAALGNGFWYVNSSTSAYSGADANPFRQFHTEAHDFRIITTYHNEWWLQQLATDFRTNHIYFRRRQNGTWQDWARIITSDDIGYDFYNATTVSPGTWQTASKSGILVFAGRDAYMVDCYVILSNRDGSEFYVKWFYDDENAYTRSVGFSVPVSKGQQYFVYGAESVDDTNAKWLYKKIGSTYTQPPARGCFFIPIQDV